MSPWLRKAAQEMSSVFSHCTFAHLYCLFESHELKLPIYLAVYPHWPMTSLMASAASSSPGTSSHRVSPWHMTVAQKALFKGVNYFFLLDCPILDSLLVTNSNLLWSDNKTICSAMRILALVRDATFSCWSSLGPISKPQKMDWLKFFGSIWFFCFTDKLFGSFSLNINLLNLTICWGGFYFRWEHLGPHLHLLRLIDLTTFLCSLQGTHPGAAGEEAAELFTGCSQIHFPHLEALLYSILILPFFF